MTTYKIARWLLHIPSLNEKQVISSTMFQHNVKSHSILTFSNLILVTVEPLQTETPENWKPLKLNDFVSPEFLSSYLNYPSKPKTPLNKTFSLVQRLFSLEGLHCT